MAQALFLNHHVTILPEETSFGNTSQFWKFMIEICNCLWQLQSRIYPVVFKTLVNWEDRMMKLAAQNSLMELLNPHLLSEHN